ncbi:hypothetical protein BC749_1011168 [Flavobacterium araucananum]|jgi:hypothetical protein|uniref:Uncharacterized protein n=1 Tax=Flavobacterium araucananum TaxID=946678 RepID=A0A227P1B7_9FLAO|nr:hypothetical protein [Flavobacterium araucananum]OXG03048.1 hypothetical protein B0A64_17795 [Flavobacterium araucananum]PWK03079.1 hypothetical protein BC749_1011168 [Flavobacterium araucananum]
MKNQNLIVLILVIFCVFGCNKNDRKNILESTTSISEKIKNISKNTVENIIAVKDSIAKTILPKNIKNHKTGTAEESVAKDSTETGTLDNEKLKGFSYFKKLLLTCKTGETLTQKELIEEHNIPKEGVKLIKSITKTAEDEIDIKWKSTWFVEKISDAKFTDARMKIKFEANKMYTSGKAIGIEYNKKIYNNLIIVGNLAYIPSVKGYHWKIGK